MTNAFITGSQAYGTPHDRSDIDVAVLMDKDDVRLLNDIKDDAEERYADSHSLRFGDLNLILFTDPVKFEAWRRATDALLEQQPVSRAQAVAAIKAELETVKHLFT